MVKKEERDKNEGMVVSWMMNERNTWNEWYLIQETADIYTPK